PGVDAEHVRPLAQVVVAAPAALALAAVQKAVDNYAVTDRHDVDVLADGVDESRASVPRDVREREVLAIAHRAVAGHDLEDVAADLTARDADDALARRRPRRVELLDVDRVAEVVERGGLHRTVNPSGHAAGMSS